MLNPNRAEDVVSLEKCRNISKEIIRFGVSDNEIVKIIELLSLEMENTELMRAIHNTLKPKEIKKEIKEKLVI